MSGSWSNDQANQILVYDPNTGTLILQIDQNGLYYLNVSNGSFFKVAVDSRFGNAVSASFGPGVSATPGIVYSPAAIEAGEFTNSSGKIGGVVNMTSPQVTGKVYANVACISQTNLSATDDSTITLYAANLVTQNGAAIGQGFTDIIVTPYTTGTMTSTTESAIDYANESVGPMVTTRKYAVTWSGTIQSSSTGDVLGLRIYTGPNNNNLTGATLVADVGQITIAAANRPQPFSVTAQFAGVPGKFALLGGRRVSGSGTGQGNIIFRQLVDTVKV